MRISQYIKNQITIIEIITLHTKYYENIKNSRNTMILYLLNYIFIFMLFEK